MKNFIFFSSYFEAIKELPVKQQGEVYKSIIEYAMEGKEPTLKGAAKSVFVLIKPYIDASRKKQESGALGGKQTESKSKVKQEQTESKSKVKQEQTESKSKAKQKQTKSKVPSNQIIKKEEEKEYIKEINKEKNTILTDSELLSLIEKEFNDKDVCDKFKEYALMRKGMGKNKAIRTLATFKSCVCKLRKLAKTKQQALDVLDYSISNCYQGLFDIFKNTLQQQEGIPYAN